jgi:hypothetical protein
MRQAASGVEVLKMISDKGDDKDKKPLDGWKVMELLLGDNPV